jgi:hypothetical protein
MHELKKSDPARSSWEVAEQSRFTGRGGGAAKGFPGGWTE